MGADRVPWSLIEKVTERPGVASEYQYDNGMRELLAYRSGLLSEGVTGFAAPTAYLATERDDGRLVLCLEDLADATAPWSVATFVEAARHLGRFSGMWLDRVPDHAWLFKGWIDRHSQPEALAEGTRIVREHAGDAGLGAARRRRWSSPPGRSAALRSTDPSASPSDGRRGRHPPDRYGPGPHRGRECGLERPQSR